MAAKREISAAVRALRSLRDGVVNFIQFEEEVKDTLNSIFEKHQTEQNVFAQVRLSRIQLGPVIEEEITIWLKSMQRRLRGRMRARDPWSIVFTRDLPQLIFKYFMEVVRKAPSSFGVSSTETGITDVISYTKQNKLLRDFARLCDTTKESIEVYFSKGIKVPRGNAKVVVSMDKPFTISYLKKKQQVMLKCHYSFTNQYGYTFET